MEMLKFKLEISRSNFYELSIISTICIFQL